RHSVRGVEAHLDGAAAQSAQSLGAAAFATGNHVVFNGAPSLHTAAHEAAHVVQQRAGVHLKDGIGAQGDAYERHADAVADRVVRGQSSEALLDEHAGGGGTKVVQRVILPFGKPAEDEKPTEFNTQPFIVKTSIDRVKSVKEGDESNIEPGHQEIDPKNPDCLKNLNNTETIYIVGHGSPDTIESISPENMAKFLSEHGLTSKYRGKIVLVSCNTGKPKKRKKLETSYAARLQKELLNQYQINVE